MFRYLAQHPNVATPSQKELHFFDINYDKGLSWYLSQFPLMTQGKICGEASPYYLYHPLVPERVKRLSEDLRLVILLRDPVIRAYSHYHHEVENGRESRSFREAIEKESGAVEEAEHQLIQGTIEYSWVHQRYSYLARGRYVEQLDRWFQHFPMELFYIETAERFFSKPKEVCQEVFEFLGLQSTPVSTSVKHNPGRYEPMAGEDCRFLCDYYERYNNELRERYQLNIKHWIRA